jgi:hypothetical protein
MPRKKSDEPKISVLKKALRTLRMKECPPISKMKKVDVMAELDKHRGIEKKAYEDKNEATMTKATEQLKGVEADTMKRNTARKSSAKAIEGLRRVESETKERNTARKMMKASLPVVPEVESESDKEEMPSIKRSRRKNYTPKRIEPPPPPAPEPKKRKVRKAKGTAVAKAVEKIEEKKENALEKAVRKARFVKGSQEAKDYMKSLRSKKK